MISGEQLTDARPGFDQDGGSAVMFTLTTSGGKKFGKITGKNIGKAFAIILDKKVISAPIIQAQIFSNGQITGNFTVQEANEQIKVTVMYGNEERWKAVRKRGVLRDKNNSLILPLIMLRRTELSKNELSGQSFQHDVGKNFIDVRKG